MADIASCSECHSSFKLIPPADKVYSIPKLKPESEDHVKRIYGCEDNGRRNTIYWHKKSIRHVAGPISGGPDLAIRSCRISR